MGDSVKITRRDFSLKSALAVLAGTTITVTGCDDDSPTAPTEVPSDVTGVVSSNHGHIALITSAQLTAANMLSLDIQGTADHPHTVALTMGEVQQIAAGTQVTKTSSIDAGHLHGVTFN